MKEVILWIFNKTSEFISTSLTWKIYGDFSFTHFILGATFIFALFRFLGFASENYDNAITDNVEAFRNAENARERKNYYYFTKTRANSQVQSYGNGKWVRTITRNNKYRVNRKTGATEMVNSHVTDKSHYKSGNKLNTDLINHDII